MATVARRAPLVLVAIPFILMSLLGVLASRPLPCEGVACAGDDLRGSLLWAAVFGVALVASILAAAVSLFGRLKVAAIALAFAALVLGVGILA
jgi:hypothetical protein